MNFLALASAFSSAISNAIAGGASRRFHPAPLLLYSTTASLAVALVVAAVFSAAPDQSDLLWGVIAGALGGLALPLAYIAFGRGPIGAVAAALSCSSMLVVTVVGVIGGAPLGPLRLAGVGLCIVSIAFVTWSTTGSGTRVAVGSGAVMGVIVGIGFGGYGASISQATSASQLWPLVIARVVVIAIAAVYWLAVRRSISFLGAERSAPGRLALLGITAGIFDVGSNLLFIISLAGSDLVEVSLITSTSPTIAALIGAAALKERLTMRQLAGILIAVAAVAIGTL